MNTHLTLHFAKLLILMGACTLVLLLNAWFAESKAMADITWLDIFGEGSTFCLLTAFLLFLLNSRPRGRVTNYLCFGLIAFMTAVFQDILDEVFQLSAIYWFDDLIESLVAPVAVVVMAYGFYIWNQEQNTINQGLRCRERFYREHSALDYVTDLYTALYMRDQLDRELLLEANEKRPLALLMIDVLGFDRFNRLYGEADGDRLLAQVARVITLNLRTADLACRYAGDRFVVLFPKTHRIDADVYAKEISQSISNLAFKPENTNRSVFVDVVYGLVDHTHGNTSEELFQTASNLLEQEKFNRRNNQYAA